MIELHGTVLHYPWGTSDFISDMLGEEPDGRPVAEYWLGAHRTSPSTAENQPLDALLAQNAALLGPEVADAFGPKLPYLLKVLSARHALSLQAHPNRELAQQGFAREEAAGIPLLDATRIYKDDWPKPELLVALTEFHTLSGFRDPVATSDLFHALKLDGVLDPIIGPLVARGGAAGLEEVFLDVLSISGERRDLVDQVLAAAMHHRFADGELGTFARTALELDETFPSDPGILAALLMNRVVLAPGEAIYVHCGRMHAHLRGTGVEFMATSDNVVRGGLTSKHIDVDELVRVVDFSPEGPDHVEPVEEQPGVWAYPTPCAEFSGWRLEVEPGRRTSVPAPLSPRVALVTDGRVSINSDGRHLDLVRGQSVFLTATDEDAQVSGDGQVFVAAPGITLRPRSGFDS